VTRGYSPAAEPDLKVIGSADAKPQASIEKDVKEMLKTIQHRLDSMEQRLHRLEESPVSGK
jgi:hypothetical protein